MERLVLHVTALDELAKLVNKHNITARLFKRSKITDNSRLSICIRSLLRIV